MRNKLLVLLIALMLFSLWLTGAPSQMAAATAAAADADTWGADASLDLHFFNSIHVSPDGGSVVPEV